MSVKRAIQLQPGMRFEQNGQTIVLHFVDGKLISQMPTWNAAENTSSSQPI